MKQYVIKDTDPEAPGQLYDLTKDPYELNNIAKDDEFTNSLSVEMNKLADKVKYTLPTEAVLFGE